MVKTHINAVIACNIQKVWDTVLNIEQYPLWRSDLSKTEILSDRQFIEYTKDHVATTFTVTLLEPCQRWEFDMENKQMKGHWIGIFHNRGSKTEIEFIEEVNVRKIWMKPFVKTYLKKQQAQFVQDLKTRLEKIQDTKE